MNNHILKISSAGNRFLLVDKRWFGNSPPSAWSNHTFKTNKSFKDFLSLSQKNLSFKKKFLKTLLSKKDLFLTDGLVVIRPTTKKVFSWICDFYNKDGSSAEMCGNATCCISNYSFELGLSLNTFQMGKEIVQPIKNQQGHYGIRLKNIPLVLGDFQHEFQGQKITFSLISPGAPHGVIECSTKGELVFDKKTLKTLAQKLRFQHPKSSQGMNVSFFQVEKQGQLKAITYERGVEDFTMACGTGALSVAFVYLHKRKALKKLKTVFVRMPGGELEVHIGPQIALFSPAKKGW